MDISKYYQYKSTTFIDFYFYSYTEYIRQLLQLTPKNGIDIVIKSKDIDTREKKLIASIEFLNGLID
jgi:hypothetical protein